MLWKEAFWETIWHGLTQINILSQLTLLKPYATPDINYRFTACDIATIWQLLATGFYCPSGKALQSVRSKFVRQEAVEIYYIPWPPKKLLPKILTKLVCQKQPAQPTSKSCQKNELQKNIRLKKATPNVHRYLWLKIIKILQAINYFLLCVTWAYRQ